MSSRDPRLGAYMIGVVSMRYGVHPQTLRLYEREGLLTPSRTEGKTRLYSDDDLERLEFILNLTRDLGVNLAGVEVVLGMRDRLNQLQEDLERLAHALESAGLKDVPRPTSATGLVKLTPHGLRKRS
jgi:MerR family transcriptional regulator, heat shock protein HspR